MAFEDYNYTMYNKFILIDPNKTPEESVRLNTNGKSSQSDDSEKKLGWAPPKFSAIDDTTIVEELNESQLNYNIRESFLHD